jgi:hypothetical protein
MHAQSGVVGSVCKSNESMPIQERQSFSSEELCSEIYHYFLGYYRGLVHLIARPKFLDVTCQLIQVLMRQSNKQSLLSDSLCDTSTGVQLPHACDRMYQALGAEWLFCPNYDMSGCRRGAEKMCLGRDGVSVVAAQLIGSLA